MGGSDSLAMGAARVELAVNGRDGSADPSYETAVSLPRMGSMERGAEVSCALCNLGMVCQANEERLLSRGGVLLGFTYGSALVKHRGIVLMTRLMRVQVRCCGVFLCLEF